MSENSLAHHTAPEKNRPRPPSTPVVVVDRDALLVTAVGDLHRLTLALEELARIGAHLLVRSQRGGGR